MEVRSMAPSRTSSSGRDDGGGGGGSDHPLAWGENSRIPITGF